MTNMKIEANYEGRQLVSIGNQLYRRITPTTAQPEAAAQWQEQIHTGEFHNVTDRAILRYLEVSFKALMPVPRTVDSCGTEIGIRFRPQPMIPNKYSHSDDPDFRLNAKHNLLSNTHMRDVTTQQEFQNRFDELQKDPMAPDTWVQWAGSYAVLSVTPGAGASVISCKVGKELTVMDVNLREPLIDRIVRWCAKNGYRCSKIQNGKIIL